MDRFSPGVARAANLYVSKKLVALDCQSAGSQVANLRYKVERDVRDQTIVTHLQNFGFGALPRRRYDAANDLH